MNKPTISMKSYRHNRETDIGESTSTRVKFELKPPQGQRFTMSGMETAARKTELAAFELATAYLRALPAGCTYCTPSVGGGDTWAEGASAFLTIEHDGDARATEALEQVVAQASK